MIPTKLHLVNAAGLYQASFVQSSGEIAGKSVTNVIAMKNPTPIRISHFLFIISRYDHSISKLGSLNLRL